jgi:CBS domain-containing protein
MSVKNVMTHDVVSIRSAQKVRDAWLVLMEADISGAPVVDDSGQLVGVLSNTDIFKAILDRVVKARSLREAMAQISDPEVAEKEEIRELILSIRAVTDSPVTSVLPKDQKILSLSPEDSLDRAIRMLAEHNVNRLPVVKGNQVVGIITRQDIIWVVAGRPRPV